MAKKKGKKLTVKELKRITQVAKAWNGEDNRRRKGQRKNHTVLHNEKNNRTVEIPPYRDLSLPMIPLCRKGTKKTEQTNT